MGIFDRVRANPLVSPLGVSGGGGAAGADTFLSNLTAPTAINQNLRPNADDTFALGSTTLKWSTVFSNVVIAGTLESFASALDLSTSVISGNINARGNFNVYTNNTTNRLRFYGNDETNFVSLRVDPALAATTNYLLPSADGTAGQFLQTNGAGNLTWAAAAASGANTTLSNLTSPTSINQSLIPSTAATRDLGTNALPWSVVYAGVLLAGANGTDYIGSLGRGTKVIGSDTFGPNAFVVESDTVRDAVFGTPNRTGVNTAKVGIYTGSIGSGAGNSGLLRLNTGSAISGNSGNIILETGTASSTRGTINLRAPTINITGDVVPSGSFSLGNGAQSFGNASIQTVSLDNLTALTGDIIVEGDNFNVKTNFGFFTNSESNIFKFYGDDEINFIALSVDPLLAASTVYQLPSVDGSSGQFLRTNGSGIMTWASAGAPSGTANTVAFFNASGVLSSEANFIYNTSTNSFGFYDLFASGTFSVTGFGAFASGSVASGGTMISSGRAAFATGYAASAGGEINSSDTGTFAGGSATAGKILSENNGSFAFGTVGNNTASRLRASTGGATAMGYAGDGGVLLSSGTGAVAIGYAAGGSGAAMTASGNGSHVFGFVDGSSPSAILGSGLGSGARGSVQNGGIIRATASGAWASGRAAAGGAIVNAGGIASFAHGLANASSTISATTNGAIAMGFASGGGSITATADGAMAMGNVNGSGGSLTAINGGCMAIGAVFGNGVISAGGSGSFAGGQAEDGPSSVLMTGGASIAYGYGISVSANQAQGFGRGQNVSTFLAMAIGRFAECTGSSNVYVATEPAFVIGNGTSTAARSNAFQVDKDGKIKITGTQILKAREIAGSTALSERTDHVLLYDLSAASGAIDLPLGEQGMTFSFGPKDTGAAVYTLGPASGDILDTNLSATLDSSTGALRITFSNGTWYKVG